MIEECWLFYPQVGLQVNSETKGVVNRLTHPRNPHNLRILTQNILFFLFKNICTSKSLSKEISRMNFRNQHSKFGVPFWHQTPSPSVIEVEVIR